MWSGLWHTRYHVVAIVACTAAWGWQGGYSCPSCAAMGASLSPCPTAHRRTAAPAAPHNVLPDAHLSPVRTPAVHSCRTQPHRRSWDRWVMMGSIGIATGLVAHLLNLVRFVPMGKSQE